MDPSPYKVESSVVQNISDIESEWLELQNRSDCSFFQSWSWISIWLTKIAIKHQTYVVRIWSGATLVGLSLFIHKNIRRRLLFISSAMFLNEYPFGDDHMVIEYNGILADKNHQCNVFIETLNHLINSYKNIDEYFLGAIKDEGCLEELPEKLLNLVEMIKEVEEPTWMVDLHSYNSDIEAYLRSLSKNKRWQIRRSMRLYNTNGDLRIEEAVDVEDALKYFEGLKEVHTLRWNMKGLPGSFANSQWEEFHSSLIKENFSKGEIQLLKVSNDNKLIGYLYNFIWRKKVYMVQSGISLKDDNRHMPGYVVHVLAIEYNMKKGMRYYDFMFGKSQYKDSLCNRQEKLIWLVFRKRKIKFLIENSLVKVVRRLKLNLSRNKGDNQYGAD